MKYLLASVPVVLGFVVAIFVWGQRELEPVVLEPIEITSSQPSFATLPNLLANTTVAVIGTVSSVEVGQTYTDPNNPDAGFISQLAKIEVETTLYGPKSTEVLVEQEAALLNGTPITVGGATPLAEGEDVALFLIEGTTSENRHFAIVGPQGRYELDTTPDPAVLQVVGLDTYLSTNSFDGLSIDEVVRRIDAQ